MKCECHIAALIACVFITGCAAERKAVDELKERENEALASAAIKQMDLAVYMYHLEHKEYPASLKILTQPDRFGKTWLKTERLVPPWPDAKYEMSLAGPYNRAMGQEKPDIYIVHPSGEYMFGNWRAGKIPTGK